MEKKPIMNEEYLYAKLHFFFFEQQKMILMGALKRYSNPYIQNNINT